MPYDIRKLPLLYVLASLLLVLVFLYWARVVLMPVALAVLLTFLLDPVVSMLRRPGLPRTPAVILVVVVAFSLLGGMGWVVTRQLTTLADALPQHTDNLKHKIAELRGLGQGGVIEKVQTTIREVLSELHQEPQPRTPASPGQSRSDPCP
ncbi:MAG: AI-2E family transporter [Candidatus Entotheonellia bacterium]